MFAYWLGLNIAVCGSTFATRVQKDIDATKRQKRAHYLGGTFRPAV
jgi:hypothetical protein